MQLRERIGAFECLEHIVGGGPEQECARGDLRALREREQDIDAGRVAGVQLAEIERDDPAVRCGSREHALELAARVAVEPSDKTEFRAVRDEDALDAHVSRCAQSSRKRGAVNTRFSVRAVRIAHDTVSAIALVVIPRLTNVFNKTYVGVDTLTRSAKRRGRADKVHSRPQDGEHGEEALDRRETRDLGRERTEVVCEPADDRPPDPQRREERRPTGQGSSRLVAGSR